MTEENALPSISAETREKLKAQGYVNHLYDSTVLPSHYIPRGSGFNSYTYLIMGLSLTGAVLAKRFHFEPTTFVFAFLAAPTMGFIQKKEADTLFFSEISKYVRHKRNPATLLQQYGLLNQSFKQVSAEVDSEIAAVQGRIRVLEEQAHR